jgi:hypothetical protein
VESRANTDRVVDALRQITGQSLGLRFELGGDGEGVGEGALEPELSEEEVIARFKEIFDAEDVDDLDTPKTPDP